MATGYDFRGLYSGLNSLQAQQNAVAQAEQRNQLMAQQQKNADRTFGLQQQRLAQASQPKTPWWVTPGGGVHPAMLAKTTAGRQQTTVNLPPQEKAYDKAAGKGLFEMFKGYQKGAAGAQTSMHQLRVMGKALQDPNFYTGAGGQSVQFLKRAAKTMFGINVQGLQSGEVAEMISKKIALSMKGDLPGPLSNSDREFLVSIAPGLSKSKAGNAALVSVGVAQAQYKIDIAKAAADYAAQNGGRLDVGWLQAKRAFDQKYDKVFSGLMDQVRAIAPSIEQPKPTAGIPEALLKSPGWVRSPPGTPIYGPDGTVYKKPGG